MGFIYSILTGKFDFITPISFMIMGILISLIAFIVRYTVYTRRKKFHANNNNPSAAKEVK